MSWHSITVKPRGGPPSHLWLEGAWVKIDNVGPAAPQPDGGRVYSILMGRDFATLRQLDGRWYIEGGGPDDKYY